MAATCLEALDRAVLSNCHAHRGEPPAKTIDKAARVHRSFRPKKEPRLHTNPERGLGRANPVTVEDRVGNFVAELAHRQQSCQRVLDRRRRQPDEQQAVALHRERDVVGLQPVEQLHCRGRQPGDGA